MDDIVPRGILRATRERREAVRSHAERGNEKSGAASSFVTRRQIAGNA